jgi:hypothetical protein
MLSPLVYLLHSLAPRYSKAKHVIKLLNPALRDAGWAESTVARPPLVCDEPVPVSMDDKAGSWHRPCANVATSMSGYEALHGLQTLSSSAESSSESRHSSSVSNGGCASKHNEAQVPNPSARSDSSHLLLNSFPLDGAEGDRFQSGETSNLHGWSPPGSSPDLFGQSYSDLMSMPSNSKDGEVFAVLCMNEWDDLMI